MDSCRLMERLWWVRVRRATPAAMSLMYLRIKKPDRFEALPPRGQGFIPIKAKWSHLIYCSKIFSRTSFSSSRLLASFNFSGAEYTATATDFAAREK